MNQQEKEVTACARFLRSTAPASSFSARFSPTTEGTRKQFLASQRQQATMNIANALLSCWRQSPKETEHLGSKNSIISERWYGVPDQLIRFAPVYYMDASFRVTCSISLRALAAPRDIHCHASWPGTFIGLTAALQRFRILHRRHAFASTARLQLDWPNCFVVSGVEQL